MKYASPTLTTTLSWAIYSNKNQINIMNSADFQSALVNDKIIPDNTAVSSNIHHPSIQPTIEASKPFNLDVGMPSCSEFQVQLASICNSHRTDMKLSIRLTN